MEKNNQLTKTASLLDFIEGTLSLVAFVSVVLISILGFMVFNPKVDRALNAEEGTVAGVNDNAIPDLVFTNIYKKRMHTVDFSQNKDARLINYQITINALPEGQQIVDLLKINNLSDIEATIKINMQIEGAVNDTLSVNIADELIQKELFSSVYGSNPTEFLVFPNQETNYKLIYNSTSNINFQFKVNIKIQY